MTERVYAAVLAGGGGTRLWPASRKRTPKQFLPLLPGGQTLLGAAIARLQPLVPLERILVVTAADQVNEVRRVVPQLPAANIVVEPEARNTAACIALAALEVERRGGADAILAVIASDQYVAHEETYRATLATAFRAADAGFITTVGLTPSRPETGYGYIEMHDDEGVAGARIVERFVEKPNRETAQTYVSSGRHLWNSGMFFFRASRILSAVATHMPELSAIIDEIRRSPSAAGKLYPTAPAISIDYGVMERLGKGEVVVVPGDFGWNDVGSWSALFDIAPKDDQGNVCVGEAIAIDARDNILYASGRPIITAIGVEGLVVVATDDAVLILPKERAQDVKEIIALLKQSGRHDRL